MGLAENISYQFELFEKSLNGQKEGSVLNLRKEALGAFQNLGIPSNRHEEWRYTNIRTNLPESFSQSRSLIIAEEGSDVKIVEDFQNIGSSAFYNHVSEVYVGANASVNITKLQTETANTTAVHTLEAEICRDARFTCTTISL